MYAPAAESTFRWNCELTIGGKYDTQLGLAALIRRRHNRPEPKNARAQERLRAGTWDCAWHRGHKGDERKANKRVWVAEYEAARCGMPLGK